MQTDIERVLLTEDQLREGVSAVAQGIRAYYGDDPFVVVAVLKGSCIFVADLVRRIHAPLELEFASVQSYGDGVVPGRLEAHLLPERHAIEGARVLLVDDILDSGRTLRWLRAELTALGAREVKTCVLLDKPARREVEFEADFSCFQVPDVFVVGYGLDLAGRYRNLAELVELRPDAVARVQEECRG